MKAKFREELTPIEHDETLIKIMRFHPQKKHCFRLHWHKRIEIIKLKSEKMKL